MLRCKDTGALRYEMRTAFDDFYTFAAACKVPRIWTLAAPIDTWQRPIIAAIETGLSDARSEGYNTHVRALTKRAYCYHSPEALIARAMLTRGGLSGQVENPERGKGSPAHDVVNSGSRACLRRPRPSAVAGARNRRRKTFLLR